MTTPGAKPGAIALGEFLDALAAKLDRVDESVRDLAHAVGTPPVALLDRAGLARALSASVKTVDRLRAEGLPCVRVADSPRFELALVLRWLRSRGGEGGLRLVVADGE